MFYILDSSFQLFSANELLRNSAIQVKFIIIIIIIIIANARQKITNHSSVIFFPFQNKI